MTRARSTRRKLVGPVVVENNIVVNNVIDVDFIQQASGQQVKTTEVQVVKDPTQAEQARPGKARSSRSRASSPKPAQDAAPPKVVEAKAGEGTDGRHSDIEATTGSIKPGQQAARRRPGDGWPAGRRSSRAAQQTPKAATPGVKPKVEGQRQGGRQANRSSGSANGKPKVEGQNQDGAGKEADQGEARTAGRFEVLPRVRRPTRKSPRLNRVPLKAKRPSSLIRQSRPGCNRREWRQQVWLKRS